MSTKTIVLFSYKGMKVEDMFDLQEKIIKVAESQGLSEEYTESQFLRQPVREIGFDGKLENEQPVETLLQSYNIKNFDISSYEDDSEEE